MQDEFTTFDIIKALRIPRERLQDWINREFIKPSTPAKGQGTKAIFTRKDVYLVALLRHLIDSGFKRSTAAHILMNCGDNYFLHSYKTLHIVTYSKGERTEIAGLMDAEYVYSDEELPPELKKKEELYYKLEKERKKSGDRNYKQIEYLGLRDYFIWLEDHGYLHFFNPHEMLEVFFDDGGDSFLDGMEWDNYYMINFKKIRRKVDMGLSGI